jgi:hypothetical protein
LMMCCRPDPAASSTARMFSIAARWQVAGQGVRGSVRVHRRTVWDLIPPSTSLSSFVQPMEPDVYTLSAHMYMQHKFPSNNVEILRSLSEIVAWPIAPDISAFSVLDEHGKRTEDGHRRHGIWCGHDFHHGGGRVGSVMDNQLGVISATAFYTVLCADSLTCSVTRAALLCGGGSFNPRKGLISSLALAVTSDSCRVSTMSTRSGSYY